MSRALGQYELLERIAVGGMAEVYRGRVLGAEGFEKHVAIKRVLPHLAQDRRFVEMLLTEARIHAGLSHRNIVQISDLGLAGEDEYFIVLEYVEGRDLRALLDAVAARRERIGDGLAFFIAGEVAHGLHFAHELAGPDGQPLGLVHRDVSPSNILLSYAGEVKLSDFGLAKRRQDQSVVGTLKGKLAYMSPEQARRVTLDRRTDIYSLGAVLFEMLAGRRLREITDEVDGWRDVVSGRIPDIRVMRPDLPPAVGALLDRALAADPAQRFPDAATFGVAVRETVASLATATAAPSAAELQALLERLLPADSPRGKVEQSKVIRLTSELGERPPGAPPLPPPAAIARPMRPTPPATAALGASGGPPPIPTDARAGTPSPSPRKTPPPRLRAPTPVSPGASSGPPPPPPEALGVALPPPLPARPTPIRLAVPAQRQPDSSVTAVVTRGAWGRRLILVAFVLVSAAAVVHVRVIPLDVLVVWGQPATLWIATDPEVGAEVALDGHKLGDPTPTRVPIRRDRDTHRLELLRTGYAPVRFEVRYDRAVTLSVRAVMTPLPPPRIEPIGQPGASAPDTGAPAGLPAAGADAGTDSATDANAEAGTRSPAPGSRERPSATATPDASSAGASTADTAAR